MTPAWSRRAEALAWTLLVATLAPTLLRVARGWSNPIAEHGPLVVAVAGWLLWRDRARLAAALGAARPIAGGGAMALALWIGHAAALEPHVTIVGPAALLAVAGHLVAWRGLPALRAAWFPLAFGLFTLPAPGPALFTLSVRLKVLAARLAEGALDAGGVAVVRVGSTLHVPGATVVVDDGCSGLRGLMAIVAFAVLLTYLAIDRRRGAAALLAAVPAAIAANVLRIVLVTLLVARGHPEVLEGAWHEATGLAVYAVAIGAVLAVGGRMGREGAQQDAPPRRSADEGPDAGVSAAATPQGPAAPGQNADEPPAVQRALPPPQGQDERRSGMSAVSCAALLALLALFATMSVADLRPAPSQVARRLPERLGRFVGRPAALEPVVFTLLGEDVAARRFVVDDPASPVDVVVVRSSDDPWRAFHPPDDCFLIGGWDVVEAGEARLAGQPARRRLFRRAAAAQLVYYWAQVGGHDAFDQRSLRVSLFLRRLRGERRRDGTLVRLSTAVAGGDLAGAERRLAIFATEALGDLEGILTSGSARD